MNNNTWQQSAKNIAALKPAKILFMCVHNSARSQLAEAIARSLAPEGVSVISAGSEPSEVNKHVITVLSEVAIPHDGLYSKSIDEIDTQGIQVVVTLCAEEVCPVFIGEVKRIHWPLPDPSSAEPDDAALEAFRSTRDTLTMRLKVMLNYTLE